MFAQPLTAEEVNYIMHIIHTKNERIFEDSFGNLFRMTFRFSITIFIILLLFVWSGVSIFGRLVFGFWFKGKHN